MENRVGRAGLGEVIGWVTALVTDVLGADVAGADVLGADVAGAVDLDLVSDAGVLELVRAADRAVWLLAAARGVAIRAMVAREAAENVARCVPAEILHRDHGHTLQRCRVLVTEAVRRGAYPRLLAAEAAGVVSDAQASAIARALGQLPDELDAQVLWRCEASLLELAATLDPDELVLAV